MRTPLKPSRKGKTSTIKNILGKKRNFTVIDEIKRSESVNKEKLIVLQKLLFEDGTIRYRLGYYIIGKKPKMAGKWVWGQYAPIMRKRDFRAILQRVLKKKWL